MQAVSGMDFTMHPIAVDGPSDVAIESTVRTNGARSWPSPSTQADTSARIAIRIRNNPPRRRSD